MIVLKENEKALIKTKKEIDNIVNAIAAGIINELLKDRLSKLEEEKNRLEIESVKIKLKAKYKLTKEDALNFLKSMIDVDNNTKVYKKRIIKRFVKKIVLYTDKMDIYLIAVNELEESNNKSDNNEELDNTTNTKLIIENGCLILQCKLV